MHPTDLECLYLLLLCHALNSESPGGTKEKNGSSKTNEVKQEVVRKL